jgi:hypothetical protein
MLDEVLRLFEQGWVVVVEDYYGDYECEDADEIADAMEEDDYRSVRVEVLEAEHRVYLWLSDDE